jgi:hypothetical protein
MGKSQRNKPEEINSEQEMPEDFFEPIKRTVETGADVSIETKLIEPEVELGQFSVGLENIDTVSITHDKVPLGLEVQYDYEANVVIPKVTVELSDKDKNDICPKEVVDSALEEYERSIRKINRKKEE